MPALSEANRRKKQVSWVLSSVPRKDLRIRAWLSDLAHHIRVQHEVHPKELQLALSEGIRGDSQSVVPRMDSYHARIFFIVRRRAGF